MDAKKKQLLKYLKAKILHNKAFLLFLNQIKIKIILYLGIAAACTLCFIFLSIFIVNTIITIYTTAAIQALGFLDKIEPIKTTGQQSETEYDNIVYGIYPIEGELRVKQEMLEICEKVGGLYNLPGAYILGVAMVETSAFNFPSLLGDKSLYKDLCQLSYKAADGQSFFINSTHTGIHKDIKGEIIKDPLRVGKLRPDAGKRGVAKAIGPFQFYSTFIEGRFTKMYVEKDGKVSVTEGVPMMSVFDEELGFLRPHPLYFPDAAVNCAAMLKGLMDRHKNRSDIWGGVTGLPERIKLDILYIYGCDAYHGDTESRGKGQAAITFHNSWAKLYSQIYKTYEQKGILTHTLGDFASKGTGGLDAIKLRTLAGGVPYIVNGSINFDGTFNHPSRAIQKDETGKYIEICGVKYHRPLITEVSNTAPFHVDYLKLLKNMRVGPAGSNNKMGWVYGFQALNQAEYYTTLWKAEINGAIKQNAGVIREKDDKEAGSADNSEENNGWENNNNGNLKFIWPVPNFRSISSPFGRRFHPVYKKWKHHNGIDIPCNLGATIQATASGKVIYAGWAKGYGNFIKIDHGNGYVSYYGHLEKILVKTGDKVKGGEKIATGDSTGVSTGHHLHFEIRYKNKPVDPLRYVKR